MEHSVAEPTECRFLQEKYDVGSQIVFWLESSSFDYELTKITKMLFLMSKISQMISFRNITLEKLGTRETWIDKIFWLLKLFSYPNEQKLID